jgi:nucleoside-diphosphate-sugar epimerase
MRICVTGGCGYIGSVLIPKIIAEGHSVDSLDVRPPEIGLLNKTDPRTFRYQNADLSHPTIADSVMSNFDLIVHLAA